MQYAFGGSGILDLANDFIGPPHPALEGSFGPTLHPGGIQAKQDPLAVPSEERFKSRQQGAPIIRYGGPPHSA